MFVQQNSSEMRIILDVHHGPWFRIWKSEWQPDQEPIAVINVKYCLADNMGQDKNPTVLSQSDEPEESDLWTAWQLFPLNDDQTGYSKTAEVTHSDGQLWEEIAGALRHVHMSAWEFVGNIRLTNWTEDSEKFRCSRKLVPSLPRVRFLVHRLLTSKSPSLIDERF